MGSAPVSSGHILKPDDAQALPVLLHRSCIDPIAWDHCIRMSGNAVMYAYSWYLNTVAADWYALVWPSPDVYKVVLPVPAKKKWGRVAVQQPFFCQYLGFFSREPISAGLASAFLREFTRHFDYVSLYCFHPENRTVLEAVAPGFPEISMRKCHSHFLCLSQGYEQLRKGYTQDLRKNLKRAEKMGWEITEHHDPDALFSLFEHNHSYRVEGGVAREAYEMLRLLICELEARGLMRLRYAVRDSVVCAGMLLLTEAGRGDIYIFNAANESGRKGNARALLLDCRFREVAGMTGYFDFESPEVPSIQQFYRKFGAKPVSYFGIRYNRLPFPFRQIQRLRLKLMRYCCRFKRRSEVRQPIARI